MKTSFVLNSKMVNETDVMMVSL